MQRPEKLAEHLASGGWRHSRRRLSHMLAGGTLFGVLLSCSFCVTAAECAAGWSGQQLAPTHTFSGWRVERDGDSSGTFTLVSTPSGSGLQLSWNLGTGAWVQARYDFSPSVDLSAADLFGLTLRGSSNSLPNNLALMFMDTNGVCYGWNLPGRNHGLNQVTRWMRNLPFPKKGFYYFWGGTGTNPPINWAKINRFFVVVKRPGDELGGGSGTLTFTRIQHTRAADWPRATAFEAIDPLRPELVNAASNACRYILNQQRASGLFQSWAEESNPKAWLYDQALVLIALCREGFSSSEPPSMQIRNAAENLAQSLVQRQKPDGHWARGWNPVTSVELVDDGWIGDQAWCVMALSEYAYWSKDPSAWSVAQRGADWLAGKIDASGAIAGYASTEGTVDTWWAMIATYRFPDAARIATYLANGPTPWDPELRYWHRGSHDPVIAMDCATWTTVFARHPLINQPGLGLDALSFVQRALITSSDDGTLCGFDGMGPVSIWNEGTAQYVAARGPGSSALLDMLLSQQKADGSMPGSPDAWSTDQYGWLTTWQGLAPTTWLYYAIHGMPFPPGTRDWDGDGVADWSEFLAGTNPEIASSFLALQASLAGMDLVRIAWPTVTNRIYTVLTAPGPVGPWVALPGFEQVPGNGKVLEAICPITTNTFYQVTVQPAP